MEVNNTHSTAAMPTTVAAMANPRSTLLIVCSPAGAGGLAGRGAPAPAAVPGRGIVGAPTVVAGLAGVAVDVSGRAPAGGGAGGATTRPGAGAGAAGAGDGRAAGAAAAPLAGSVGNLMVAVGDGFGGRLMRTVSFFGCTLAESPGFGGTPPPGVLGVLSAIANFVSEPRGALPECQWLYPQTPRREVALCRTRLRAPRNLRDPRRGPRRPSRVGPKRPIAPGTPGRRRCPADFASRRSAAVRPRAGSPATTMPPRV
jgi:hypothetical protein